MFQHVDTTQRYMSPGDVPKMEGLRSQVEHRKNGRRLMNHHIQVKILGVAASLSIRLRIARATYGSSRVSEV